MVDSKPVRPTLGNYSEAGQGSSSTIRIENHWRDSMTTPTTPGIDLDKLEALARAATPISWKKDTRYMVGPVSDEDDQSWGMVIPLADVYGDNRNSDVTFISAANPATILALIDLARRASATPSTGSVAAALPGDWTAEWDTYSAPGTIRLHSPKWGGAFLGEPKSGDIALPAIVYRLLAEILSSATPSSKDAGGEPGEDHPALTAALDGMLEPSGWAKYRQGDDLAFDAEDIGLIFQ